MQDLTSSDLSQLFRAALESMETNRQEINRLDGYNGNHGDNMVQNLETIAAALEAHEDVAPSESLRYASRELAERGRGSTSQYYVTGLSQAAERLEGRSTLGRGDVMTLVQSLLDAVPSQGYPQQVDAGGSVLEQVLGMASSQVSQGDEDVGSPLAGFLGAQAPQPSPGASGAPLEGFLGGQQASQGGQGSLGAVLGALLGNSEPQAESFQDDADAPESLLSGLLGGDQSQGGGDALGGMLGALLGSAASQGEPSSGDESAVGLPLGALLGAGSSQGQASPLGGVLGALLGAQSAPAEPQDQSERLERLMRKLLPAALAFLRAKQSGAEMPEALTQALMSVLASRQMNPLQARTPRAAAGGLVAQSMLQKYLG
jgi:hypothetical protein